MTTYPALRNIHLGLGLVAGVFLMVYGLSAVEMVHPGWLSMNPSVSRTTFAIAPGIESPRVVASLLMERSAVRGELDSIQQTQAGFTIRVIRPGTAYSAAYDRGTGTVTLLTSMQGLPGMLTRLHRTAGIWHEDWMLRGWTILVALVSLALIGLGASGVGMWFVRRQDRLVGLVLLILNLAVGIALITLIRIQ